MRLSIIIVNYKSADFILDCLQSAAVFESFHQFEWIVIDNDSKDDSKQKITTQFPSVRWKVWAIMQDLQEPTTKV